MFDSSDTRTTRFDMSNSEYTSDHARNEWSYRSYYHIDYLIYIYIYIYIYSSFPDQKNTRSYDINESYDQIVARHHDVIPNRLSDCTRNCISDQGRKRLSIVSSSFKKLFLRVIWKYKDDS